MTRRGLQRFWGTEHYVVFLIRGWLHGQVHLVTIPELLAYHLSCLCMHPPAAAYLRDKVSLPTLSPGLGSPGPCGRTLTAFLPQVPGSEPLWP